MATKALTPVARCASHDDVSEVIAPGREQDWRDILIGQNASAIWHSLYELVRSSIDDRSRWDQLTQEMFLHLIISGRAGEYIEQGHSNEEIQNDLISYLTG